MERTRVQTLKIEKRDVVKNETEKIETNAFIIRETDKIIYRPVDIKKPMILDGKKFINTEIEKEAIKEIDSTKIKKEKVVETSDNSTIKTDKKEDNKTVNVDRDYSFNFWDWIWLFLAAAAVYYVFTKRKWIISWFV
ncbi:hypothetical protein [Aquimarina sp. AU58]|uniref:hypothetical protein n=1 Tax=Aquimarina sp. AU58 TaxID=1874112 RepID=UPI000D6E8F80|nr:hypothetical protein [Aquimarina sp. AU58]